MKDKTVAIVGGSSGIGLGVAQQVVAAGGRVFIGGRDAQRLERALAQLGPAAGGHRVDSADDASVAAFFAAAPAIDHLFTPGASYALGRFTELDEATARSPMDHKFWGQYRVVRHALPKLSAQGSVVLMAGALGARVGLTGAAYAACNCAIEGLGRALARELAPRRFNTVSPGTIDSELWRARPAALLADAQGELQAFALGVRLTLRDAMALRDAAAAGFGLARLPRWLVAAQLADGTLEEVLPQQASAASALPIHVIWPHQGALATRQRVVVDHLLARFVPVAPWER